MDENVMIMIYLTYAFIQAHVFCEHVLAPNGDDCPAAWWGSFLLAPVITVVFLLGAIEFIKNKCRLNKRW